MRSSGSISGEVVVRLEPSRAIRENTRLGVGIPSVEEGWRCRGVEGEVGSSGAGGIGWLTGSGAAANDAPRISPGARSCGTASSDTLPPYPGV